MSAFDSVVKKVSNLPSTLGAKTGATSVSVVPSSDTMWNMAPFTTLVPTVHAWARIDNAQWTGQVLMAAPTNSAIGLNALDIILSTDTAFNVALYQATLADYVTRITTDGGTHLWKLDEASGNAASSIGSATLTATATPTYAAASWVCADGQAVSLNGSTQGFKTSTKLATATTGAIEAWIWLDTAPDEAWAIVTASDEAGTADYLNINVLVTRQPNITLAATAGGILQNITGNITLASRQWYHIVWQQDGSTVKLFVNGRECGVTVANTGTGWYSNIFGAVDNFVIGYLNTTTNTNFFQGKIANVAWYANAVGTAASWKSHFDYGAPIFGPHAFPANGGIAQPQRVPIKLQPARPIYIRSSTAANATVEVVGYEDWA